MRQDPELEGEEEQQDDGASLTTSTLESTESLSSSIREYRNIHGRTYGSSKTTAYWQVSRFMARERHH